MTSYDLWLDELLEDYYEDIEEDLETQEWDGPYPEDGYDYDYE